MPFSREVKARMFARCMRHCCLCRKQCGTNIEAAHIIDESSGGSNDEDNGIPLCFDCHQEIGAYRNSHPKGNKFTPDELLSRRDKVYGLVQTGQIHPERAPEDLKQVNAAVLIQGPNAIKISGPNAVHLGPNAIKIVQNVQPTPDQSAGKQLNEARSAALAQFVTEAQQLRGRLDEDPLPIADHNEWVDRTSEYLRGHLGAAYEVRFSDFSGMVFYGDGSDRSQMSRSLDGRTRRLHEFLQELAVQ